MSDQTGLLAQMSDDNWLQHVPFCHPDEAAAAAERHEEDKRRVEDQADQQRALEHLQLDVGATERSVGAREQPGPWTCMAACGRKPAVHGLASFLGAAPDEIVLRCCGGSLGNLSAANGALRTVLAPLRFHSIVVTVVDLHVLNRDGTPGINFLEEFLQVLRRADTSNTRKLDLSGLAGIFRW